MKRGHIVRYVNDCYLFGIGVYYLCLLFIMLISLYIFLFDTFMCRLRRIYILMRLFLESQRENGPRWHHFVFFHLILSARGERDTSQKLNTTL
jgi:hypothetical protein